MILSYALLMIFTIVPFASAHRKRIIRYVKITRPTQRIITARNGLKSDRQLKGKGQDVIQPVTKRKQIKSVFKTATDITIPTATLKSPSTVAKWVDSFTITETKNQAQSVITSVVERNSETTVNRNPVKSSAITATESDLVETASTASRTTKYSYLTESATRTTQYSYLIESATRTTKYSYQIDFSSKILTYTDTVKSVITSVDYTDTVKSVITSVDYTDTVKSVLTSVDYTDTVKSVITSVDYTDTVKSVITSVDDTDTVKSVVTPVDDSVDDTDTVKSVLTPVDDSVDDTDTVKSVVTPSTYMSLMKSTIETTSVVDSNPLKLPVINRKLANPKSSEEDLGEYEKKDAIDEPSEDSSEASRPLFNCTILSVISWIAAFYLFF